MERPTGVSILAVLSGFFGAIAVLAGMTTLGVGAFVVGGLGPPEAGTAIGGLAVLAGVGTIIVGLLMLVFAYGAWTLRPWAWMVGVICQVLSLLTVLSNLAAGAAFATQITSIAIPLIILYYLFTQDVKRAFGRA